MFRVSGEVEYNLSVIPALCGQLRPRTTLHGTRCHLHGVSAGVEEDYMDRQDVSQQRFMSEIEAQLVVYFPSQYVCRHVCVFCYRCEVNNHNIQTKRKCIVMCFHWSQFILYLPGALMLLQLQTPKASRKSIKVPQNKMYNCVFSYLKSFSLLCYIYMCKEAALLRVQLFV